MFEDLDEPAPTPMKRSGKAKSLAKSGPACWPPAEVDGVCQNKYTQDWPEMRDYCRNYLSDTDQKTFNLRNHSKYLDIILSKPGITQDMVFTKEAGQRYFAEKRSVSTDLYNQGLLMPLPTVPGSKRFPDKEIVATEYVMVIVPRPSSQTITNNDPDRFGHTCLIGLWGLHTKKVLVRCHKKCLDGVNRITAGFCPFCEYWTMNDSSLNNHIRKHYGMVLACYHDGYTTGSVSAMKRHMTSKHGIEMESALVPRASSPKLFLGFSAVLDAGLGLPYQPYSMTSIISSGCFFLKFKVFTIPGLEVYNRHHSQQNSISFSQYFRAPTRLASWVHYFYISACHVIIL